MSHQSTPVLFQRFPSPAIPVSDVPLPDDEIAVQHVFRTLWRHKFMIAVTVALITGLSWLSTLNNIPVYRAEALVLIAPPQTNLVDIESVVRDTRVDLFQIQTQVETLRTEELAARVVDKLRLTEDPAFTRNVRISREGSSGALDRFQDRLKRSRYFPDLSKYFPAFLRDVTQKSYEYTEPAPDQSVLIRAAVVGLVRRQVEIEPLRNSYLISVKFDWESPSKAAQIANAFVDTYIENQVKSKSQTASDATKYLSERIEYLRRRMLSAQSDAETFRASSGLLGTVDAMGRPMSITNQEASQISGQLVSARAELAGLGARLRNVESVLKPTNGIESAAEVLQSPLIQGLRVQEALLLRREAELRTTYGERHPRMIEVRAEFADLTSKIAIEVNRILLGLRNEADISRARVASLATSLDAVKSRAADETRAQIELNEFEREAASDRDIYETFLARFKETSEQQDTQEANAQLASAAIVPAFPVSSRKLILLGFVTSLLAALLLVVFLEKFHKGFRTAEEFERSIGLRVIGIVPRVGRRGAWRNSLQSRVQKNPTSPYGDAIQAMRTFLHYSNAGQPRPKVVLVTSALRGEGKSAVAESLVKIAALAGERVVLVDCDLRQKKRALRRKARQPGLAELLMDECSIQEALTNEPATGFHKIAAGGKCRMPPALLRSAKMKKLVSALSLHFDLIVLDSPAALAVSDAAILSHLADQSIFLVRWGRTHRETALAGLKEIQSAAGNVDGVMLTRANTRKLASYGFAGARSPYGPYRMV